MDQALYWFIRQRKVPTDFLSFVASQTSAVIPSCSTIATKKEMIIPPLETFVEIVSRRSSVDFGTLLASLALLRRLKTVFTAMKANGCQVTHQRIFLTTLIITAKAIHDYHLGNRTWAKYTHAYFTLQEINRMEIQLLQLMGYNLNITPEELNYSFFLYHRARLNTVASIPRSISLNELPPKQQARLNQSQSMMNLRLNYKVPHIDVWEDLPLYYISLFKRD